MFVQEGVGEEGMEEEEVPSSEAERQGRGMSIASSGPDPLVTQEEEDMETREPSEAEEDQEESEYCFFVSSAVSRLC